MWTQISTALLKGDRLDLYERNGLFMIRVNGWELMNGAYHQSEDQLGRLAALLPCALDPDILLGGLGLGYTLASLLDTLNERIGPGRGRITVAERSGAVLEWFGTHINPSLAATLPPGTRLAESDVVAFLGAGRRWDVIMLDIDNGPEALSTAGNAALYRESGLTLCRNSLAPSGHLLLWSSFEDPRFVERAQAVGFSVTSRPVPLTGRPDQFHLLYLLSRRPLSRAECERLGVES